MRRVTWLVGLLIIVAPMVTHAQQWSGIIDPSRAIDWSSAGIPGGIPKRNTICATLDPGATAPQINSAIQSCPSGQVVFLNAGTYNLNSGITFNNKSNVTLRGAGSHLTKLVFNGNLACHSSQNTHVCLDSADTNWVQGTSNSASWTGGFAKGTTVITLSSTTKLAAGSLLILDQLDDTSDGGAIFICETKANCTGQNESAGQRPSRGQQELHKVVSIAGNQVTITPPIAMPNWRASQSPEAWWPTFPIRNSGIEDMTLDHGNNQVGSGIYVFNAVNVWIKGVRSINAWRNHVWLTLAFGTVIRDSYFYGSKTSASTSYGIEWFPGGFSLIENNIFQHVTAPLVQNAGMIGDVVAYNFAIDDHYDAGGPFPQWMIPMITHHATGDAMILWEGNDGLGAQSDNIHGTHHFSTYFRNHFYGDVHNNPPKTDNTAVMHLWAFSRFFNVIGNVLGRTGYYDTYEVNLTGFNSTAVYSLGDADSGSPPARTDPFTKDTLLRWGNYDTVTGTVRFLASEVPSGLSNYANPVPGSQTLPSSLYRTAKPFWFGTLPWPPIGPDVAGGNISGYGGHANKIPARLCYENSDIDGAYGSANVRLFNPITCYGVSVPPNRPTGLILR